MIVMYDDDDDDDDDLSPLHCIVSSICTAVVWVCMIVSVSVVIRAAFIIIIYCVKRAWNTNYCNTQII